MNAKEYLQQLKKLDIKINQKVKELGDLKIKARSIGSIDYSKERVQSSLSTDAAFVKTIDKIAALESEINREINKFVYVKNKIINQIQRLENSKHIDILYKHYVEFKDFKLISKEMYYTYDYIRKLHGNALQEFERRHTITH